MNHSQNINQFIGMYEPSEPIITKYALVHRYVWTTRTYNQSWQV